MLKRIFVLCVLIQLGVCVEVALNGDVYVEGIFSLYTSENSDCDSVDPFSVQVMEAVKWVYNELNNEMNNGIQGYIPGIKIGLKIHETCRSVARAAEVAYDIIKDLETTGKSTVGILGPVYSSEAIEISRLFSSLPERLRLLQISHSATATSLNDHHTYRNFYRTIPSDKIQVETMLHFMQKINWTYVAIIHDDDAYGREAVTQLLSPSGPKYTCFPEVFPIATWLSTEELSRQLRTNIESLQTRTNPVRGIAIIGSSRLSETTLKVINELYQNDSNFEVPKILTSEAYWSVEKTSSELLNVTKGSFLATPPRIKIQEIYNYWNQQLSDIQQIMSSTYLSDVYHTIKHCNWDEPGISCNPLSIEEIDLNFPQPFTVQYAVQAALIMAKAIKGVYDKVCNDDVSGSACIQALLDEHKQSFLSEMNSQTVDFDADFGGFRLEAYKKDPALIIHFSNKSSDPEIPDQLSSYDIYNKRTCEENEDMFCLVKVMEYSEATSTVKLFESAVRDYDVLTGEELRIPNISKPQCPEDSTCWDCPTSDVADMDITEGDLYIVGIAPVNGKSDTPIKCGPVKMGGFDVAEAIKFQIDYEMKTNPGSLPTAKIGSIIINSCNDPQWIIEKIVSLHRLGIYKDGKFEQVGDKIIGYIAGWVSDVSIAVAEILSRVKQVQISYGSTSPRLSDRSLYPYFMRVVQNDDNQGKVMLETVKELGSDFVQVLYSESAYGKGGKEAIVQFAEEYGVCISQTVMCPEDPTYDLDKIIEQLTVPGSPKIMLSFLSSFDVVRLLKKLNGLRGYVIIASEAWGNRGILDEAFNLNGSITLANELPISNIFIDHMKGLRPDRTLSSPWLEEYMEMNFNCYFEWSYNKQADIRQCGPEDVFNPSHEEGGFKIETWVPFAATAVQALLYGSAKALDEMCKSRDELCSDFRNNPDVLIRQIKTVNLRYDGINLRQVFDDKGDGLIAYNRYLITVDNGKASYKMLPKNLHWAGSVCDDDNEACKLCNSKSDAQGHTKIVESESDSSLLIAVIILAVLVAILLAIFAFSGYAFRRKMFCFKVKEDPYLTPGYLSTISRTEGDGGMISTLSEKEENRERKENKYY